jgi:hypothetical protein
MLQVLQTACTFSAISFRPYVLLHLNRITPLAALLVAVTSSAALPSLLCFTLPCQQGCIGATLVAVTALTSPAMLIVTLADKLMGHAIETIMMSVNSGKAPTSRSLGVKFLFISWAIFSVIMLAAYTGEHSKC